MKLGSLKQGRDGHLVVISGDLTRFASASAIVPTLQAALDEWETVAPKLERLSGDVERGEASCRLFDQGNADAPLPRAYQWADGSAYVNHVALVRRARGAELPESFWSDPLVYQGGSDSFLGPQDSIPLVDEAWGLDFEAEVVVVVGDVPRGATREQGLAAIRLVGLTNDISLRNLIPGELAKGFGFYQSKPSSAFCPAFVTPAVLGYAWRDGKLHGVLNVDLNGAPFGRADTGIAMTFDFGTLIAHLAKTRALGAGTIIGSGTVSNRGADGGPGMPTSDGGSGYSCIAEIRMVETIMQGSPATPFLKSGDTIRISMEAPDGTSLFGAIEQTVCQLSSH